MNTNTINKGDLVMTEHGGGFYDKPCTFGGYWVYSYDGELFVCQTCEKQTRQQVEEWAKGKGYKDGMFNWHKDGFQVKFDGSLVTIPKGIPIEHFDTAPEQQAEAILLARMLNATKQ